MRLDVIISFLQLFSCKGRTTLPKAKARDHEFVRALQNDSSEGFTMANWTLVFVRTRALVTDILSTMVPYMT